MRLSILLCSAILFLTGCAGSQSSISQSEAPDFQIKKTICSMRKEVADLLKSTPVKQPVCSGSIVKGCQPVLYFDLNSDKLLTDSIQNLDWVVLKMLHYDRYQVSLIGHTDQTGDEKDNLLLSEKRAHSVQNYLLEQGIDEARIKVLFKGETEPICEEYFCNELNRRVEVQLHPVNTDFSDLTDFVSTKVFNNQKNEE